MPRRFFLLLCSAAALAQAQPREPFGVAAPAYHEARASRNFDQAAERREEVRRLLTQTPAESPLLANRVQTVAGLYRGSGRQAQARAVVQDALLRADSLGESHPTWIQLLGMLADSWQQAGNLLQALSYREKLVAAAESAPPESTPPRADATTKPVLVIGTGDKLRFSAGVQSYLLSRLGNNTDMYQQLADLYRQLGRPESAAKVMAKMRSRVPDDPRALAAYYEAAGEFDEAIALYKKQAEQAAANPQARVWEQIGPLQSLSSLYQRQERWADAAAAIEQAVVLLEPDGTPERPTRATSPLRVAPARVNNS